MLQPPNDLNYPPGWFRFILRHRWKKRVYEYKTQWILHLTDEEVKKMIKVFKETYVIHDRAEATYYALSYYSVKRAQEDMDDKLEYLLLQRRKNVNAKEALELYQLLNNDFFIMYKNYLDNGMFGSGYDEWAKKVKIILSTHPDKILQLNPLMQDQKSLTQYDIAGELSKAGFSDEIKNKIYFLKKEVELKQSWTLDDQTRHDISKIVEEYIPGIINSHKNLVSVQHIVDIKSAEESISVQLNTLTRFVKNIENNYMNDAVYTLKLQEELIRLKHDSPTLN